MKFAWCLFITIYTTNAVSQSFGRLAKPPLDMSTFDNWLSVMDLATKISEDGRFVLFYTRYNDRVPPTLHVKALNSDWSVECPGARDAAFTRDGKKVVYILGKDSLCILTLGTSRIKYTPQVSSVKLFMSDNIEYLVCQSANRAKDLFLEDINYKVARTFVDVDGYWLSKSGNSLILETGPSLIYVNMLDNKSKEIWRGTGVENLLISDVGDQIVFEGRKVTPDSSEFAFWYYKKGSDEAVALADDQSRELRDNQMRLGEIIRFSADGKGLFCNLVDNTKVGEADPNLVSLDIWSYMDTVIQSEQLAHLRRPITYMAEIMLGDGRIKLIQKRGEEGDVDDLAKSDEFIAVDATRGDETEMHWSAGAKIAEYLISIRDGNRRGLDIRWLDISPDGRYLEGRAADPKQYDLGCYDLSTASLYNVSQSILSQYHFNDTIFEKNEDEDIDFGGWLTGKALGLIVYDKFDIWNVDPSGYKPPVNLTNGYGRKHKIKFTVANQEDYSPNARLLGSGGEILLKAFDVMTKREGFYVLSLDKKADPKLLTMGDYHYQVIGYGPIIKARCRNVYIVERTSAEESPNLFWTTDFRSFLPISNVRPERNYNWLTSELVHFEALNGEITAGVIYKPEDFDASKRYPVIITYYQQYSDWLNSFDNLVVHDYAEYNISIPWFVSHGYVVFIPDINSKKGESAGKSAYYSVMGAADYLRCLLWADSLHMGIMGHSFGGFETNYIVTHTGRFAAAITSSGVSDLVFGYLDLWGNDGPSTQGYYESGQYEMGATLWDRQADYLDNSAVLLADRVKTPLMILADKEDGIVHFSQGLAMFLALRRLGKRCWLLQYDGQAHKVVGKSFIDFTTRCEQYFDYYLKDLQCPTWMARGLPAKYKKIDDGLELQPIGIAPGLGLDGKGVVY
jgi:hypothetical protein